MRKMNLSRRTTLLALAAALVAPVAVLAQQTPKDETDEEFMSRMERQFSDLATRVATLDEMAQESTFNELRNLRLKTRSLKKRIARKQEDMAEQYLSRDEVEFDRDQWTSAVRGFEMELKQMERDLRPF
jgi:hypothetical protein